MRVDMVDPQGQILREIENGAKRDDIVSTYAWCIRQHGEVDFAVGNRAIRDRWSKSAVEYVKTKAWKWIEERAA